MNESDQTNAPSGGDRDEPPSSREADGPPEPDTSVQIDVLAGGDDSTVDVEWLRESAAKASRFLHRPLSRLSVRIVGDQEMALLHDRFSGVAGTTDVLTFPGEANSPDAIDVDIAVCVDEAQRHARSKDGSIDRELLLYIVHGLLHCDGENDDDPEASARMHRREDEILSAIGVGAIFDTSCSHPEGSP